MHNIEAEEFNKQTDLGIAFCFQRSSKRKATVTDVPLDNTENRADEEGGISGIDVRHLTKVYATQTAVDDLSFCARFGKVSLSYCSLRSASNRRS